MLQSRAAWHDARAMLYAPLRTVIWDYAGEPVPDTLLAAVTRVAEADAVRRRLPLGQRRDEDVADPLGEPKKE